ncbi:MAG: hypothetical protein OXN84_05975 [Albidovulum sp.]|nr:hypothetical protein [Albidovulum sp.]
MIREAFRIERLTDADCRSIFFDWALGLPDDADLQQQAARLHAIYAKDFPDHPMTRLLKDAQENPMKTGSRRGRFSRRAR